MIAATGVEMNKGLSLNDVLEVHLLHCYLSI